MRILGLLLAYLPTRIFYIFSEGIAFMLRKLVGYRKSVVESNIDLAFPNLSQNEKHTLAKKFYTHFLSHWKGLTHFVIIPYHPQANGDNERWNAEIVQVL
jgi:lauroyl/myristoyl acyltransferase